MSRRTWNGQVLALAAGILLGGCASTPAGGGAGAGSGTLTAAAGADAPAERRSVLASVYTEEQAARGQRTFQLNCAGCHSTNQFSGPVFQRIWTDRPVGELYGVMSTLMPQANPGSLSAQEYTDIVSYFLSENGYPTGDAELPANPAVLDQLFFEPVR